MNAYVCGLSLLFPLALVLIYDDNIALITANDKSFISTTNPQWRSERYREKNDEYFSPLFSWEQWRRCCEAKWNKWKRKIEKICFSSPNVKKLIFLSFFTCSLTQVRASNHKIYFSWMLLVSAPSSQLSFFPSHEIQLPRRCRFVCVYRLHIREEKILFQHEKRSLLMEKFVC